MIRLEYTGQVLGDSCEYGIYDKVVLATGNYVLDDLLKQIGLESPTYYVQKNINTFYFISPKTNSTC